MPNRFRYHGYAIGAAGRISSPFFELIEVQAAAALPQIGGHGSARSVAFKYREIVRFDAAHSEVTGSSCDCEDGNEDGPFYTRIKSTVEGLNVLDMVTVDRVVATLSSTYTPDSDGQPSVKLIGTRFENLRIAGIPVEVDLATDVFDRFDTHRALAHAYKQGEVRELVDNQTWRQRSHKAPPKVARWLNSLERCGDEMPSVRGVTSTSLVRELAAKNLEHWGHVILIPGFGTVRLAELEIRENTRVLNMIQLDLDCPYKARLMVGSIADGGDDY
ncbi:MAG: hypothetical protein ABI759_25625 [Candidatus Solibacter sp.]